ncbi:MAG: hypothetical protein Ct9H300mP19_16230 [Dehalococcoidia bacterium]|nr:MAG: hypothetical protein Ct9H300mP19_16230 [Dehalococcoidia bacterium]
MSQLEATRSGLFSSLDIGADGVQVPQINEISDARKVVPAAKYAPLGERGVSVFTRAGNYYKDDAVDHPARQNDETMTVVHIEGQKGLTILTKS